MVSRVCGRRWFGGESVSALRLPDAPNIMFNDINFLLNGPRFDSEVRTGGGAGGRGGGGGGGEGGGKKRGTTPGRIICGARRRRRRKETRFILWGGRGGGGRKVSNRPGNTHFLSLRSLRWPRRGE